MNKEYAKMYPVSKDPAVLKPGVKLYAVTAVAQTIDLSEVVEDVVIIRTSNALATTVTINGQQPGMTIICEYAGGAVADHTYDFGTKTITASGITDAVANANDEVITILAVSKTRGVIIGNVNGVVVNLPA